MANSVDPDEMTHNVFTIFLPFCFGSTMFAKVNVSVFVYSVERVTEPVTHSEFFYSEK